MEQIVLSDPAFRQDRGFVIQRIEWREEDLINILRKRLTALSRSDSEIRDQTAASFDTLCVPELRGDIENDLAQNANGNPRYLMNLCAQMVTAHCSHEIKNQDNIFELNRDDYLGAIDRVKSIYRRISINQKFQGGEVLHGRYRVEKIINTSHSQIVKAWDESLKRFVAIKSPRIEQFNLNESLVERFHKNLRREAELLAKLCHQNIAQVFDIFEEPFGVIMEWIEGQSLHEILDRKERLSVHDILMIGIEVADALAYAHQYGVIHRDINPKNIVLTLDKTAKLIDFDAAKYDLLETITMREDGSRFLVGTPRYSSPEQLAQPDDVSLNEIGPASDIFSLGVVLYELLTMEIPYEYGNRLTQYADNVFPKPKSYEVPKLLYKILIGMLDGKTSRRPKAEDLKHELQNCIQTLKSTDGI
jgi:tRNA A-37 threonylcarbamoyl transferase component Bud32